MPGPSNTRAARARLVARGGDPGSEPDFGAPRCGRAQTTDESAWKGACSAPPTLQVAPNPTIGRDDGWILPGSAGHSSAGRAVELQPLDGATGEWTTLRLLSRAPARTAGRPRPS